MADDASSPHALLSPATRIVTPAGSTIEPELQGGYRVCDAAQHCTHADNLWQAQQLVQWAEVHHRTPTEFISG